MFLLTGFLQSNANELQRLVFNAAGNIGLTAAFVEVQGLTPGNSATLNGNINTAITMLNQLISQYNDPPFESDQIRKIVDMLQRFPVATAGMNNQARMSYLQNCYSNLKSAMSLIFRSDFGTKYSATCDTYITDLGYASGQAQAAIMMNNRAIESEARSRINLALSSGTRTRDTLGCSFLSADQIRVLDIQNRRTAEEFSAMLRELENDVRAASLNLEPGFDSPATKGKVAAPVTVDPPAPNPPADPNDLTGSWQAGKKIISREGGYYVVRYYEDNPTNSMRQSGYQHGMVVLKFADRRDGSGYYYGQHFLFMYEGRGYFVDAAIEHGINPGNNQQFLKVHYTYDGKKSWISFTRDQR
jgi:hypothetical protein